MVAVMAVARPVVRETRGESGDHHADDGCRRR
jgi:hypothetical protein